MGTPAKGEHARFTADFESSGVQFVRILQDLAKDSSASETLKADWAILETWLGCRGRAIASTDENRIAEAWFSYLSTCEAPTEALRTVFEFYQKRAKSSGIVVPRLSPTVEGVFSRILGSQKLPSIHEPFAVSSETVREPRFVESKPFLSRMDASHKRIAFLVCIFGLVVIISDITIFKMANRYRDFFETMFSELDRYWFYRIGLLGGAVGAIGGFLWAFHFEMTIGALRTWINTGEFADQNELERQFSVGLARSKAIAEKDVREQWNYFIREIRTKQTLPLVKVIEAFIPPIRRRFETHHPLLLRDPTNWFLEIVQEALINSNTHPSDDIVSAMREIASQITERTRASQN